MLVLFISSCSSCVQLQRASSLGGLNKENSPLKSVNRSVNESSAVRKRTAGIALGEQENCPSALTATPTKNSLCSPSTKVDNWPNTVNYSLHDAPQVLCVTKCGIYCQNIFLLCATWYIIYWFVLQKFRSSCLSEVSFNVHRNIEKVTTVQWFVLWVLWNPSWSNPPPFTVSNFQQLSAGRVDFPLDMSLKSKARFTSSHSFTWTASVKTHQEANGISKFVRSRNSTEVNFY